MGAQLMIWSEQHLGQWHYVLGYLIVLVGHNWPIIIALLAVLCFAFQAYIRPSRTNVSSLLTALIFGFAYEYEKHVMGKLHIAIDFLFGREIVSWNWALHMLVGPVANTILLIGFLAMLAQSIWQDLATRRAAPAREHNLG